MKKVALPQEGRVPRKTVLADMYKYSVRVDYNCMLSIHVQNDNRKVGLLMHDALFHIHPFVLTLHRKSPINKL